MKFKLIIDPRLEEQVVVTAHSRSDLTDALEAHVRSYSGADQIPGYTDGSLVLLKFTDIACVNVLEGSTWAILCTGERFRLKYRLYELERLLPACFIRINKSSLANENRLERFAVTFSGGVDALFQGGYREYVSRRCFAAIKRRFDAL